MVLPLSACVIVAPPKVTYWLLYETPVIFCTVMVAVSAVMEEVLLNLMSSSPKYGLLLATVPVAVTPLPPLVGVEVAVGGGVGVPVAVRVGVAVGGRTGVFVGTGVLVGGLEAPNAL